MATTSTAMRDVSPTITTFTTPFNRFAPLGFRKFVAVGLRATAIVLHDSRILLLNPIPLEKSVRDKLTDLGGVDFIAADLGHHLYVKDYLSVWPSAKTIGVPGLERKRKDIKWDFIYSGRQNPPEDVFDFAEDVETVLFEGFITFCVAWYHKPSKTLLQSDLMMNLACTEVRSLISHHHPSSFFVLDNSFMMKSSLTVSCFSSTSNMIHRHQMPASCHENSPNVHIHRRYGPGAWSITSQQRITL